MPASRKLLQYKSHKADLPCDKCRFQAVREKGTRRASGKMSFYTNQYARYFGKFQVSVNYHMALHIPEVIQNWGHPTSWWCFPYERHIGMLHVGDVNTSGKTVEKFP